MRKTEETSVKGITAAINKKINTNINDAKVRVFNMPSIPGLSAVGGFEVKLQNLQKIPLIEFESFKISSILH